MTPRSQKIKRPCAERGRSPARSTHVHQKCARIYQHLLCFPPAATGDRSRSICFITLGDKFPRLSRKDAKARVKEIEKLLLAL
jgi:hypothetical protein